MAFDYTTERLPWAVALRFVLLFIGSTVGNDES
jgi:hypothetical protein